jgi:hypothetical protein
MGTIRRKIISTSLLFICGCTSRNNNSSNKQEDQSQETEQKNTPTESYTQPCKTPEENAEYALSKYKSAHDELQKGQSELGIIISNGAIVASKEQGLDANSPDGLIIEKQDDGDTIITLAEVDDSAIYKMRNNSFYDAIEQFRAAQTTFAQVIEGHNYTIKARQSPDGLDHVSEFLDRCDSLEKELLKESVEIGISTAKSFLDAAVLFEEECKAYLDNEARFEENIPEAQELQERAISKLEEGNYPESPGYLEDRIFVYSPD